MLQFADGLLSLRFGQSPAAFGESLIFFLGLVVRILAREAPGIAQDVALIESKKIINSLLPIPQKDLLPPPRLVFGEV